MPIVLRSVACLWLMLTVIACGGADEATAEQPPAILDAPAEENSVDSIRVPPAPLRYAVLAPTTKGKAGEQLAAGR